VALGPRLGITPRRAPTAVVLVEDADDYFLLPGPSPFGHRVATVARDRTQEIPLVVRSDGTCRIQTIDAWRSPRLHDLLARYRRRTGRPVLAAAPLPTDDRAPRAALSGWERAALDAVFLDGHLVVRAAPPVIADES
jgi:carbamoyltransferase